MYYVLIYSLASATAIILMNKHNMYSVKRILIFCSDFFECASSVCKSQIIIIVMELVSDKVLYSSWPLALACYIALYYF